MFFFVAEALRRRSTHRSPLPLWLGAALGRIGNVLWTHGQKLEKGRRQSNEAVRQCMLRRAMLRLHRLRKQLANLEHECSRIVAVFCQQMLPTGLLPTLLLVLGASVVASAVPEQQQQREQRLFAAAPSPHSCGEVPVDGLELSPAEQELLQYICWPQEGAALAEALLEGAAAPRGVPAGVNCTVVQW